MGNFIETICNQKDLNDKSKSLSLSSMSDSQIFKKQNPRKNRYKNDNPYTLQLKQDLVEENKTISYHDFEWKKYIGKGTFGKVALVTKKNTGKLYAMKILNKKDFDINGRNLEYAVTEKNILIKSQHPFIVSLYYSFQDNSHLYYCIDYIPGGELFDILKNRNTFNIQQAKFYSSEVLLALEYLHEDLNTIYRDLKPENVLLCTDGHVKLTDFGLSKMGTLKTYSFCGTPEYLAPEIILNKGHSKAVDFWTFGCLIYEMLMGKPPFMHKNQNILFNIIKIVIFILIFRLNLLFLRILIIIHR